jgi:hypothetical protein
MLLTLSDMPSGWTSHPATPIRTYGCNFNFPASVPGLPNVGAAGFGAPGGNPFWFEFLAAGRQGTAVSNWQEGIKLFSACHHPTTTASSGAPAIRLTLTSTSFPAVGDQSGTFRWTGSLDGKTFNSYVVSARFGSVDALFFYDNFGSDISAFENLVNKAGARIRSYATS